MFLIPMHHFKNVWLQGTNTRKKINQVIEQTLFTNPDIDLELEPKYLAKSIIQMYRSDLVILQRKVKTIIVLKSILAFLTQSDKYFTISFMNFRWVLQFIHSMRKYPISFKVSYISCVDIERILSLYAIRSLNCELNNHTKEKLGTNHKIIQVNTLEGILLNVIECTTHNDMTYGHLLDKFMLSQLFIILGESFESISIFNGTLLQFEGSDHLLATGIRPEKDQLEYMIRQYILALTLTLDKDKIVLVALKKIIMGLLLYGDIHIEIIFFFFQVLEFEKNVNGDDNELDYFNKSLVEVSINLVNNLINYWIKIKKRHQIDRFRCPLVLIDLANNDVIMVRTSQQFKSGNDAFRFLSSFKLEIQNKFYNCINESYVNSRDIWQFGISLIKFWKNCYEDNKGTIPSILSKLLNDYI